MRMLLVLLGVLIAPAFGQGQVVKLDGPICGFVFDPPSRTIRPLLGIPGAAHLGAPTFSNLDFAAVSPDGRQALAVRDGQLWILRDPTAPIASPIDNAIDHPERIIWASDSSTAALYSSSARSIQRVQLLVGSPQLDPPIDTSFLPGPISALAVDTKGRIAVGVSDPAAGGVYLFSFDKPPAQIASVNDPSALVFSGKGLYIADRQSRSVLEIPDLAAGGIAPFLAEQDGVVDPAAIAISPDQRRFYLASREDRTLRVYQINTRSLIAELPLDSEPSRIDSLSQPSLFALNTRQKPTDSLLLLDGRSGDSVYFVPAAPIGPEE